jgi:hypothetical protein
LKVENFTILKTTQKCDNDIESYSTTGFPKMLLILAASLG